MGVGYPNLQQLTQVCKYSVVPHLHQGLMLIHSGKHLSTLGRKVETKIIETLIGNFHLIRLLS